MNLKINVLPYLAALVILLVPSCLKDQVSYFDQSAAERLQAVQKKTRETLAKPRYGWRMEYFIGNVDFDFGGKHLTLEFGARGVQGLLLHELLPLHQRRRSRPLLRLLQPDPPQVRHPEQRIL